VSPTPSARRASNSASSPRGPCTQAIRHGRLRRGGSGQRRAATITVVVVPIVGRFDLRQGDRPPPTRQTQTQPTTPPPPPRRSPLRRGTLKRFGSGGDGKVTNAANSATPAPPFLPVGQRPRQRWAPRVLRHGDKVVVGSTYEPITAWHAGQLPERFHRCDQRTRPTTELWTAPELRGQASRQTT